MNSANVVYNLGPIVDWVEAIGTVGAVMISLWLALSKSKEKLSIHKEYLGGLYYFWITNNSNCNVSVELIGIREYIPGWKKLWFKITDNYIPDEYVPCVDKPVFQLLHPGETSKKYTYAEDQLKETCGITHSNNYPVEILFDDGNGKSFKKSMYLANYRRNK